MGTLHCWVSTVICTFQFPDVRGPVHAFMLWLMCHREQFRESEGKIFWSKFLDLKSFVSQFLYCPEPDAWSHNRFKKVGQLSSLLKINFHDKSITGMTPSSIRFFQYLRDVHHYNNCFSCCIPVSIGSCPMLQTEEVIWYCNTLQVF